MRLSSIPAGLLGLTCSLVFAQESARDPRPARDPQIDELRAQIAQLSRTIADQGRRIAELEKSPAGQLDGAIADQSRRIAALEKTVKVLQQNGSLVPPKPDWRMALNWALIRNGMSEKQVVDLLGPPTRVTSVVDVRTLYYQSDPRTEATLRGSVTLKGDRVTGSNAPDF